ncbi:DUF308 domain-containing protein [Spirosoma radiotolerans]|uniref:DUF308 domain-containing protein n=1 Tax=Spirosoma radiotolerans TaxID=1379870 RepID=UPI00061D26A5|nr:DUF308 domain-containing protein [Spirosoma radiotolerans]
MPTQNHSTPWGFLLTKGLIYVLLGVYILMFAQSFTPLSGQILGSLFILAGIFQFLFSSRNHSTDNSNIWGYAYGLNDIGFGIAIVVDAMGDTTTIVETMAFWAMVYAVLQSVQAMYSFIAARGGKSIPVTNKLIHAADVLVAGGMSYVLLSFTRGFDESMRLSGLFPIGLGLSIFVLTQQMRSQAAHQQRVS